ncbi:MAG TPA: polyphenol oxidase family protein [Gemmatimonadaceae bacterium]|nr:polyphenol oxidase family protein [Gemmatimonadaceae bacterium]
MAAPALHEPIDDFAAFGIRAFTTNRADGSCSLHGDEPVGVVTARWAALREELGRGGTRRLATAGQVHGSRVVVHSPGWEGSLRVDAADGHASVERGTAMAVTVADCVPVFVAHPGGATAILHSGWRGTVGRITERGIEALAHRGVPVGELHVHLGPAICGKCYEVSPEVYGQLTGRTVDRPTTVDLRSLIADAARAAGVRHLSVSPLCTRCDNDRLFSHRAGDAGRQLGVIVADA